MTRDGWPSTRSKAAHTADRLRPYWHPWELRFATLISMSIRNCRRQWRSWQDAPQSLKYSSTAFILGALKNYEKWWGNKAFDNATVHVWLVNTAQWELLIRVLFEGSRGASKVGEDGQGGTSYSRRPTATRGETITGCCFGHWQRRKKYVAQFIAL